MGAVHQFYGRRNLPIFFRDSKLCLAGQYAFGDPVCIAPVGIVQAGDGYTSGSRSVGKFTIAQIDADMAIFPGRMEENQIPDAQRFFGDGCAGLNLQRC